MKKKKRLVAIVKKVSARKICPKKVLKKFSAKKVIDASKL